MVGFGESIASLIHQDSVWISRIIAVGILLLLLGNYICICPTSPPALCYYQTVFSAGHCCEVRILSHYALHCAVMWTIADMRPVVSDRTLASDSRCKGLSWWMKRWWVQIAVSALSFLSSVLTLTITCVNGTAFTAFTACAANKYPKDIFVEEVKESNRWVATWLTEHSESSRWNEVDETVIYRQWC